MYIHMYIDRCIYVYADIPICRYIFIYRCILIHIDIYMCTHIVT